MRDAARKTQRTLDKALKEIAGWNDEIEKSASDRHAIYRRCRLEEIDLPLVKGKLSRVPIEEERLDEGDMDVDDEGTQRVREVDDYGVEPDFEQLDDEDREVSFYLGDDTPLKRSILSCVVLDVIQITQIGPS